MNKLDNSVKDFLIEQKECTEKILQQKDSILKIIKVLVDARDKGCKIYTFGNGGSASTSSHFVSDLLKTAITKGSKRFNAISLVDNIPVMLAWANDTSYEDIFYEQLKNSISLGDIIIAFSGSGKSSNVVKALKYGKKCGAFCIGFTGMSGGEFVKICDICFIVPSNSMLTIESMHLVLCHCLVSAIRNLGKPLFTYDKTK